MAFIRSKLVGRRPIAERTLALEFEKPAGFEFAAGQAMEVKLLSPPETDAEGDSRAFSIASAPSSERLEIGTRLRETAFKRTIAALALGAPVELDGPFGSLTLHKAAARAAVFVAGGIGVTPFMSILRQAAAESSRRVFYLIACNRRPADAPYAGELPALASRLPGLKLLATMTKPEEGWTGRSGRVSAEWLKQSVPELSGAVCYAAGPPAMVAAMRRELVAAGADEDSIRTEDFAGY